MQLIIVALAVAAISMTVTRSFFFRGFRNVFDIKIFKCPYCFAHWVSLGLWSFLYSNPFDFAINVFATIALSVVPMYAIELLNILVTNGRFCRSQ